MFSIVCLRSKLSQVPRVCLWVPNPHPKVLFLARASREGLTADNHSVILDPVVVVVHIGAAALVKDLLIAAVMGMTAPGMWATLMIRQVQAANPPPPHPTPHQWRPRIICFSPSWSALQTAAPRV